MSEPKTQATTQSPAEFLNSVEPEQKRKDGLALLEMFQKVTGEKPVMWGTSIVGFGKYLLKSEKNTQGSEWPLVGFSPRKQNLTLYIMPGNEDREDVLEELGKYKKSVSCIYLNKLSDADQGVLAKMIENSYQFMKNTHLK